MLRFVGALLLSAALLVSANSVWAAGENRVALVIGNGQYQNVTRLPNPPNDAQLMAATLREMGFSLVGDGAQIDLDRLGMERAIREFGTMLIGGGVGLFYYAGHGVQLQGVNYLVPVGANPTSIADVDFEFVSAELVIKQMEAAGSKLNFVILDACRNNPFGGRGLRDSGGGLAQMKAPTGTLISYATQPGNVALDGLGGHSPYTTALADAMQKPGLRVLDVFNDVGLAVDQKTGGRQQPWVASSPLQGDFYFRPASKSEANVAPSLSATAPAQSAPSSDVEMLFWQTIAQSSNLADFQEYLRQYPNGRFAGLARNRIGDASPSASGREPMAATVSPPAASISSAAAIRSCGSSDEQIMQPVKLLYQAVNAKNLDLYAAQWADGGRYVDIAHGIQRTKDEKIEERRARFATWEMVSLTMDRAIIADRSAERATVKVVYSMTVKDYGRPAHRGTKISEQYDLICSGNHWLIQVNTDENR